MTAIKPCTEERYFYMLEVLPLAIMDAKGFCVGEAVSHRLCTVTGKYFQPTFAAFFQFGTRFFEAENPMTIEEYKAITPEAFRKLVRDTEKTRSTPHLNGPAP
jgi:hypothetical protein